MTSLQESTVAFIFGEVDARAHILRQRDIAGRPISEIIKTLCSKYLKTVTDNLKNAHGSRMIVCSVAPPTFVDDRSPVPSHGSIEDRISVVSEFNTALQKECECNGVIFMDLFKYFRDPWGVMNRSLSDSVHVCRKFSDIIEYELEAIIS